MKVEKYKCIKAFRYDVEDDDGRPTYKTKLVKEGSLWNMAEHTKDKDIKSLDRWRTYRNGILYQEWINVDLDRLNSNFEKVYRYEYKR